MSVILGGVTNQSVLALFTKFRLSTLQVCNLFYNTVIYLSDKLLSNDTIQHSNLPSSLDGLSLRFFCRDFHASKGTIHFPVINSIP